MDYYLTGQTTDEKKEPPNNTSAQSYENDTSLSGVETERLTNSQHTETGAPLDQSQLDNYIDELRQVDEEIKTLQQVLAARFARQHFLRRQLGITAISELRDEVKHGIENLRASDAYQRTTAVMKTAKEKTSATIQEKWSLFKNTNVYKKLGDTVGPAYSSVRDKLTRPSVSTAPGASSTSADTNLTETKAGGDVAEGSDRPGDTQKMPIHNMNLSDDEEEMDFVNTRLELDLDEQVAGGQTGGNKSRKQKKHTKQSNATGPS